MSVFENLIEELKKEQLIEETVLEFAENQPQESTAEAASFDDRSQTKTLPEDSQFSANESQLENSAIITPADENEFYRRRAMEEVSSLQMVEHILSGVEREQMKKIPQSYDSIPVSQALHEFLQVSKNINSPENAAAEFKLMQETESWHSALAHRDKNILSAQLRRYCETAKPVLSAQALAALARFYRNSSYSESVRSKFDMVITRLFSNEENDERVLAFGLSEIVQHLSELYADWASVSLYATDDDSEILEMVQKFEDFIDEAEAAANFEQLVQSDFYNRLRAFKEQAGENCYAPSVAATMIVCNVSVGNIYVRLLIKERHQTNSKRLENKYSHLLDQTISEAASKTLKLTALLQEKNTAHSIEEEKEEEIFEDLIPEPDKESDPAPLVKQKESFFAKLVNVNKWLLGLALLVIVCNVGLYFWTSSAETPISTEGVVNFSTDEYYFKDYLRSSKIVNENLMCIVKPNWDSLSDDKKQEVLKNMLEVGKEKGFTTVWLQNKEGQTVGYLSADNIKNSNSNQK